MHEAALGCTFVFSSEALFKLGAAGSGAVLDRTSGMGHYLECGGVSGLYFKVPCRRPCTYLDRQQPDRRADA